MDLHQTLPPSYNNVYQSSGSNHLVPLQRSQSLQQHPPPAQYYHGSSHHPLNAQQPLQPGLGYPRQQQQQYVQQQHQLHAPVAPSFTNHPSQSHLVRVAHRPQPHQLLQHHQQQHSQPLQPSPVQHQQVQHQQYNLPVHHHVLPIQPLQPIAATRVQVQHVDNQEQLEVNTQSGQQPYEPKADAHLEGLKLVPDPPDLDVWRQRLFDVDDMIVVSEEE